MDRKLRKYQNLLVNAGSGVILFAVWSVAKMNLYLGISGFFLDEVYKFAEEFGIGKKFFAGFLFAAVTGVLIWQLSTRLYIGINAVKEGKGTSRGWVYLVVAALLLITDVQAFFGMIKPGTYDGTLTAIGGLCVEAASLYVLVELLISGIQVKLLRKKKKA